MSSKNWRTLCGSAPSKSVVFVVTRNPRSSARRIPSTACRSAFAADREIVVLALAIHVDRKRKVFARRELVQAFLSAAAHGCRGRCTSCARQDRSRFRRFGDASKARRPECSRPARHIRPPRGNTLRESDSSSGRGRISIFRSRRRQGCSGAKAPASARGDCLRPFSFWRTTCGRETARI